MTLKGVNPFKEKTVIHLFDKFTDFLNQATFQLSGDRTWGTDHKSGNQCHRLCGMPNFNGYVTDRKCLNAKALSMPCKTVVLLTRPTLFDIVYFTICITMLV